jgi:hypothetical protein
MLGDFWETDHLILSFEAYVCIYNPSKEFKPCVEVFVISVVKPIDQRLQGSCQKVEGAVKNGAVFAENGAAFG